MTLPGTKKITSSVFLLKDPKLEGKESASTAKKEQSKKKRRGATEEVKAVKKKKCSKIKIYTNSLPCVCDYAECSLFLFPLNPHHRMGDSYFSYFCFLDEDTEDWRRLGTWPRADQITGIQTQAF